MRRYGGCFDKPLAIPFPVFLTRSGIPRCIPVFHRRMIKRRDAKTDQLVRALTIFTFQMNRQNGFFIWIDGQALLVPVELLTDFRARCVELGDVSKLFEIPMGLRWEPMWTSSSVYYSNVRRTKDALCRPFHRMILEFFSIEIFDK